MIAGGALACFATEMGPVSMLDAFLSAFGLVFLLELAFVVYGCWCSALAFVSYSGWTRRLRVRGSNKHARAKARKTIRVATFTESEAVCLPRVAESATLLGRTATGEQLCAL
jgi:hypothetical protein